jgi:hypothetical protein
MLVGGSVMYWVVVTVMGSAAQEEEIVVVEVGKEELEDRRLEDEAPIVVALCKVPVVWVTKHEQALLILELEERQSDRNVGNLVTAVTTAVV